MKTTREFKVSDKVRVLSMDKDIEDKIEVGYEGTIRCVDHENPRLELIEEAKYENKFK